MESNENNQLQENPPIPESIYQQPVTVPQQPSANPGVILQSKINIQRTASTYVTKPGTILTDGKKITIVRDDGKVLLDRLISDIKYVKMQFSIIYIYYGFNKVYTVSFADHSQNDLALNMISGAAGSAVFLEKANEAKPESEKWADLFRQNNIKFVGPFKQAFMILRNFAISVILFFAALILFMELSQ